MVKLDKNKKGLLTTIGSYRVYKSENKNESFCYVDEKHNRINDEVFSIMIYNKKGFNIDNGFNILGKEYSIEEVVKRSTALIEKYDLSRREYLTKERLYRNMINSIEPINYKFKNLTFTIITQPCYYNSGELVTKKGTCYSDKKVLLMFINGTQFSHNKLVIDVNENITLDIILDKIFHQPYLYHYQKKINYDTFKTIECDMDVPKRSGVLGFIWSIEGKKFIITNVMCYSNNYGDSNCTVCDIDGKNSRREKIKIKDLQSENIVGRLNEDSMLNFSILMNKYTMLQ